MWRDRRLHLRRTSSTGAGAWRGSSPRPGSAPTATRRRRAVGAAQDLVLLYMTNCPEYLEGMVGGYLGRVGPANVNYRYTAPRAALPARRRRRPGGDRPPPVRPDAASRPARDRLELLLVVDDGTDAPLPTGAVDYEEALAAADRPTRLPDPDARRPLRRLHRRHHRRAQGRAVAAGRLPRRRPRRAAAPTTSWPPRRPRPPPDRLRTPARAPAHARRRPLERHLVPGRRRHRRAARRTPSTSTPTTCSTPSSASGARRCNIVGDAFGIPLADAIEHGPARDLVEPAPRRHRRRRPLGGDEGAAGRLRPRAADRRHRRLVGVGAPGRGVAAPATGTFRALGRRRRARRRPHARVLAPGRPQRRLAGRRPARSPAATSATPAKTAATFPVIDGVRYVVAGDRARLGRRRQHRAARPRVGDDQHRRREGVRRGGRGGAALAPGGGRRRRGRPAERAVGPGGRRRRRRSAPAHDVADDELREACAADARPLQAAPRRSSGSTPCSAPRRARPTTPGPARSWQVERRERALVAVASATTCRRRSGRCASAAATGRCASTSTARCGGRPARPTGPATAATGRAGADARRRRGVGPRRRLAPRARARPARLRRRRRRLRRRRRAPTRSSPASPTSGPGLRMPRSLAVYEALLPAVLSQKVTGLEAKRAWRGLVRRWGEPAPGPPPHAAGCRRRPTSSPRVPVPRAAPARRRAQAGRRRCAPSPASPAASTRPRRCRADAAAAASGPSGASAPGPRPRWRGSRWATPTRSPSATTTSPTRRVGPRRRAAGRRRRACSSCSSPSRRTGAGCASCSSRGRPRPASPRAPRSRLLLRVATALGVTFIFGS